ncbi:hypothetical protein PCE1_000915 [Barthelona sp. PCE]
MGLPLSIILPFFFLFGTGTMISAKILMQTKVVNSHGLTVFFERPWFQTLIMFLAMSLALIKNAIDMKKLKKKHREAQPLLGDNFDKSEKVPGVPEPIVAFLVAIPATLDLLATTVMSFGLVLISVSVMQCLRAVMIAFAAILEVFFAKQLKTEKKIGAQWFGVILAFVGVFFVGYSSVLSGAGADENDNDGFAQLIGCLLVVISQFIQASQIICERFLLKSHDAPDALVVGCEGGWGSILCLVVFLPLAQLFKHKSWGEDVIDDFYVLRTNFHIKVFTGIYFGCILGLNMFGMMITSALSATHRTLFEALRTVAIWVVDLGIYYWISKDFGEAWTIYSYLELFGFIVLVIATLIYNKSLKVPGFFYPTPKETEDVEEPARPAEE